ncbi:MAG: acyl-homoserine-lactone synthase [Polyangiales bacterium]
MAVLSIGRRSDLGPELYDAVCRYRHEVFVRRLGWSLAPGRPDHEEDEFDTEDTVYVVARALDGRVCGLARLLPTTRPYLLGKVFPQLVRGPAPSEPTQWELSRFAADAGSGLARRLFARAVDEASARGATHLVGVLSTRVERSCHGFGAQLVRLGDEVNHDGETIVACAVNTRAAFVSSGAACYPIMFGVPNQRGVPRDWVPARSTQSAPTRAASLRVC